MDLKVGDHVHWTDRDGGRHVGYIAAFVPKREPIPHWFLDGQRHPKGIRIRKRQIKARRDDRWIVDCGMAVVGKDEGGKEVTDVVYRMVPTWSRTIVKID